MCFSPSMASKFLIPRRIISVVCDYVVLESKKWEMVVVLNLNFSIFDCFKTSEIHIVYWPSLAGFSAWFLFCRLLFSSMEWGLDLICYHSSRLYLCLFPLVHEVLRSMEGRFFLHYWWKLDIIFWLWWGCCKPIIQVEVSSHDFTSHGLWVVGVNSYSFSLVFDSEVWVGAWTLFVILWDNDNHLS